MQNLFALAEKEGIHEHTGMSRTLDPGTSIQRRSFQLCSAHSTSCTLLAPSRRV